jgi:hypothetical protein
LNRGRNRRRYRSMGSIRKSGFMEYDIPRDVHSARFDVKAFIAFVVLTIPEENTLF